MPAPKPCAASSSTNRPSALATAAIASWSAGRPNRSTGITAFGVRPSRFGGRDRAGNPARVDIEGRRHRHRRTPASRRPSAATSAVAQKVNDGQNTASPGPMPLRAQRQHQRVGAAGAGDRMAAPQKAASSLSNARTSGPENELAMVENARDRGVDRGAKTAALRGDVDERNWRRIRFGDSSNRPG